MQKKCVRTDFGELLARSWHLFGKSLGASFPIALLCGALPVAVVFAAVYIGLASAFEPAMRVMQAVLRSLLESGFDEWAMGAAVEQVLAGFGGLNPLEIILRALSSLGVTAIVLVLLFPVLIACRLVLVPIGRGAAMQAQLCALRGEKARFAQSFAAVRKRMGRLIAVELLSVPPALVVFAVAVFIVGSLGDVPAVGGAATLAACLGALTVISCVRLLAALLVAGENARVFDAFSQAVKRFFCDWAYVASGSLFYAGLLGGAVLIAAVDVLVMILAMLPPVAVVLFMALFAPLLQAMCTVMYAEQTRRAKRKALQTPEQE